MKKKRIITRSIVVLLAAAMMMCALSLTAYAVADDGGGDQYTADPADPADGGDTTDPDQPNDPDDQAEPDDPYYNGGSAEPDDDPANSDDPSGGADDTDGGNGYNEFIEDPTYSSSYTEPEYLGELPTVDPANVPQATAVVLPDVEVSDATLFSGIVMWLCVAVGIAVVVGVMVSKRTHRRGL